MFAMLAATFPRIALLIVWIFTEWITVVFEGNWLWPLLGLIFLPFTTLMYVLLSLPVGDINLGGWLLLGLAVFLDITHWGQLVANRQNGMQLYNQYSPTAAKS
jgi:hypothetical protein